MSESAQVVREFCQAVAARDAAALARFFTEDAIYHNMPMAPNVGREAVLADLAGQFARFAHYEYQVLNLVADGDTVLTERIDLVGDGIANAPVPVMGTFELRDGKIAHWRDYFDRAQSGELMAAARAKVAAPA